MFFFPSEAIRDNKKWMVKFSQEVYNTIGSLNGSFTVLPSRLFGLEYAEYLRLVRDEYGAELIGRNEKGPYVYVQFNDKKECKRLCDELNERWGYLLKERERRLNG